MNPEELYKEKFEALKINKIKNEEERMKVLDEFSSNYLLLPEVWQSRVRFEIDRNAPYKTIKNLLKRALFDFYAKEISYPLPSKLAKKFLEEEKPFEKLIADNRYKWGNCVNNNKNFENDAIEALKLPNAHLDWIYENLDEYSGKRIIDKTITEQMEQSKKYYEKIKAAKGDIQKWLNCLEEFDDVRFLVQSVEARIAEEPFNIELWESYIKYLQQKHGNLVQEVYYRYRRLFINNSIEGIKENFKLIENPVKKQQQLGALKFRIRKSNSKKKRCIENSFPLFFDHQACHQNFPFHANLLRHVYQNCSIILLKKLYQSCKVFYQNIRSPICYRLALRDEIKPQFFKEAIFSNEKQISVMKEFENIVLDCGLVVEKCSTTTIIPSLIPKLKRCEIRYLTIRNQSFTVSEYEFLTNSKNIKILAFIPSVEITDHLGNFITFEDLIKNVPKAKFIVCDVRFRLTSETFIRLAALKMGSKTDHMRQKFTKAALNLNLTDFLSFLKEILCKNGRLSIEYNDDVTQTEITHFSNLLKIAKQEWKDQNGEDPPEIYDGTPVW